MTNAKRDPSKTRTIRAEFERDATKRFRTIGAGIRDWLIEQDRLGVLNRQDAAARRALFGNIKEQPVPATPYVYERAAERVAEFEAFLQELSSEELLELLRRTGRNEPWTDLYIRRAYSRGLQKSHNQVTAASGGEIAAITDAELNAVFHGAFHAERVALLYTRTFNGMAGIQGSMAQKYSDILARGMSMGKGPYQIAKELAGVDGSALSEDLNRAKRIARTEVVNAHNHAGIAELERLEGEIGKPVYVIWLTALDDRVRSSHVWRHGVVFERQKALELSGEPNCRCDATSPYIEDSAWSERTRQQMVRERGELHNKWKATNEKETVPKDPKAPGGKWPDFQARINGV